MRKGLTFAALSCALLMGVASCNQPSSGEQTVTTKVEITNKAELQKEWKVNDAARQVTCRIQGVIVMDAIESGDLVITSSDPSVVSIAEKTNMATPVGAGEATITATYKNGQKDSVAVTIKKADIYKMASQFDESKEYLLAHQSASGDRSLVAVKTTISSNYYLGYESDLSNAPVAKVIKDDESNKYSIQLKDKGDEAVAKTVGVAVTAKGKFAAGIDGESVTVSGNTFTPAKALFELDEQFRLVTTVLDHFDNDKEYKLVLGASGTYDTNGFGLADSITNPTRLYELSSEEVPATGITVDPNSFTLAPGQKGQITFNVEPFNTTDTVTFASSNKDVATVSASGEITAVAVGDAEITVKANDKVSEKVSVKVEGEALNFGSETNPLSVAEARNTLDKLGKDVMSSVPMYVKGVVKSASWDESYKNGTFIIRDEGGDKDFTLYRCVVKDNLGVTGDEIKAGDEVTAYGYGELYKSTYELTTNNSGNPANPTIIKYVEGEAPDTPTEPDEYWSIENLTGVTLTEIDDLPYPEESAESTDKYTIIGRLGATDATYGNSTIETRDGKTKITVYGMYDVNGNRYDAIPADSKPGEGDVVVLQGIIQNFKGTTKEIKSSTILQINGVVQEKAEAVDKTISELESGDAVDGLHAVVMAIGSDNKNFFIDDGTAGILVYSSTANKDIKVGDSVDVSGNVTAYNSALQIGSATLTASSEAAPSPSSVTPLTEARAKELFDLATAATGDKLTPIGGRYSLRTGVIGGSGDYLTWEYGEIKMETGSKVTAGLETGKIYDIEGYVSGIYKQYLLFVITSATEVPVTAEAVSLDKSTASVKQGATLQLTASSSPAGSTLPETVTWTSSDENEKVTVSNTGLVSVAADATVGVEVTITASCGTLTPATCVITVTEASAATEVTVTKSISDIATANNWSNGTQYLTFDLDSNITITATGKTNTGKYYTNGNDWRIYQNENPTITISGDDVTLVSVTITYTIGNTGILLHETDQIASGTVVSVDAASIVFGVGNTGTATNGQVKITSISVTYLG